MNKLIAIIIFSVASIASVFGAESKERTIEVVAATLYHEARGEGEEGMRAVASVIYNRAQQKRWKKLGYSGVCLQKKQFSCHNNGFMKANPKKAGDKKAYKLCVKIATEIANGTFKSTVGNANHYCTNNCKVYWKKQLKNKKVVKNHVFGIL